MITLDAVLKLVNVGPYDVAAHWEDNGHYYFRLFLRVGNQPVPFTFAIPVDGLHTHDDAVAAVKEQLKIVAAEHEHYIKHGVPPGGMPLWA